jgi:hypothetical protein
MRRILTVVLIGVLAGNAAAESPLPPVCEEAPCGTWSVEADYVLWWLRRGRAPAALTAGPPGSPVLYGDDRLETRHGDRFNGLRLDVEWRSAEGLGVEGRAFFLERDSTFFKAVSDGSQPLALPFVDAATGQPGSVVVAGFDPRRGLLSGGFVGYSRIELFGEEANAVVPLAAGDGSRLDLLAGARFLQMRDRYWQTATSKTLPDQQVLMGVSDNYRADNTFYGAQVGLRGEWSWQRFFVQVRGTAALGADDQKVRTKGEIVAQSPLGRMEWPVGMYVQGGPGSVSRWHVDAVGELALNVGYSLTEHVSLVAGYTFLGWADPVRAADQVVRVINTHPGPQPAHTPIPFKSDTFWAQGVNLGIEVRW